MLLSGNRIIGCPVLSLHMGGTIARTTGAIIDPHSLKIIAFYVEGATVTRETGNILETKDVREFSNIGMIVDSVDDFVLAEDVINLKKIIDLNFNLIGMKVVTKKGTKLGKVSSYTLTVEDFMIQQLIVQRPAIKALMDPELVITRSEIVEIDDYKIVVKDEEKKIREKAQREDFIPNFVNPFRKSDLAEAEQMRETEQTVEATEQENLE